MVRDHKKITDAAIRARENYNKTGSLKAKNEYKAIVREQNQTHSEMLKDSRNH